MDFFDEQKWAEVMRPVLEGMVDRAAEKLAPALEQAIKGGLDGLEVDITVRVRQKGTGTGGTTLS